MAAYYNEIDPQAAQWLRNLIAAGLIAAGDVDCRSILEVRAHELAGYTQCHFFAGIGVWSHALRGAGWDDARPVWTGSCPCQPFSDAGAQGGFTDDRHLWPAWFELIRERRPRAVFGEQVASKVALTWLDHVHADLEAEGYTVGAIDTCAAGFGAPHIRQRLFFVADALRDATGQHAGELPRHEGQHDERTADRHHGSWNSGAARVVGDAIGAGLEGHRGHGNDGDEPGRLHAIAHGSVAAAGSDGRLADDDQGGREIERPPWIHADGEPGNDAAGCGPVGGWWAAAEWLPCTDGKARPVEPGTFPLAHGAPARLVRLRAYGNAIVAPVAEEFIRAYLDVSNSSNNGANE